MKTAQIARCFSVVLGLYIFLHSNAVLADTPDIIGQWYGSGTVNELGGASGSFSMNVVDTPSGLLAITYIPDFGLFDQLLPVFFG